MKRLFLIYPLLLALPASAGQKQKPAVAHTCPATDGTDLVLPKGAKYQILSYDEATKTYKVYSTKFTAEGDSSVTLEGLAKGIKEVRDRKYEIAKKPDDIVDSVYTLDNDVPTLFPKEIEARRGCQTSAP